MSEKVLKKSSGSFLWVRLILQEFENAWTQEAMETVLEDIPADLFDMYSRMVQAIEIDKRKLVLAQVDSGLGCFIVASLDFGRSSGVPSSSTSTRRYKIWRGRSLAYVDSLCP